jgi:large subunit ribosomal protein L22
MATRTRQKTLALQVNKDKRPVAHARYIRISPYKVRTVLALVRGLPVNQALATLRNMPRGASEVVYKLVVSAVANAENNLNLDADTLYIAEITASQGPHLKRMVPKAKGSSGRILKRTSHLTVRLDGIVDDKVNDKAEANAIATKAVKSVKSASKPVPKLKSAPKSVNKMGTKATKPKSNKESESPKTKTTDKAKTQKETK